MNMAGFSEIEILQFFASLIRVSALFMLLPIFGDNGVPVLVRVFLAFTINIVVYPIAVAGGAGQVAALSTSELGLALLVLKESAVGLVIGFTAKIFFDGLSFAFGHMGNTMGFNMAAAYDHHNEVNMPIISQMIMILAMLLFLALDGHHLFIRALVESYKAVPLGEFVLTKAVINHVLETSSQLFWIAVKLSAPMALMIFLINCAFGIISKAVPQINVLIVSFTVNILAGFFVLTLTMPVFGTSVGEVFQLMIRRMMNLIHVLA
jgi:flagellar biosynthetic protein FliR